MSMPMTTPNPAFEVNTMEYAGDPAKKKLAPPPPALAEQYTVIVNRYYFKDRPTVEAFVDHGDRLRTRHDSPPAVQGMLTLAESRGWDAINVSGSHAFRQTVWLEASGRGLAVSGYPPTAQDQAALEARRQAREPASSAATLRPAATATPTAERQPAAAQAATEKPAVQAEKAKPLREAFETLDKRTAMERFPELTRLYPLVAHAVRFANEHLPDADNRAAFIKGIKARGIDALAQGHTLPSLSTSPAPSPGRRQEKSQDRRQERAAEVEP